MEAAVLHATLAVPNQVIMRAELQAKITEVVKGVMSTSDSVDYPNMTRLKIISTKGRVETSLSNAQTTRLAGELFLTKVIADQMKIGATITITISDEDSDEGIT
jgi:hypothetical protein